MFRPKNNPFKRSFFILLAILFLSAPLSSPAQASLTISPLRVIFDGRTRSADIMLINTSTETNTYRIGWHYNKMNSFGTYEKLKESFTPEFDVGKGVLFSPRQVTIPPEGRQRIRLSLRRPPDLADGEYRAHLVFQKLPNQGRSPIKSPTRGQAIALDVVLGFSIPIIVRQGAYDCALSIVDPKFIPASAETKGKPQMALKIERSGKNGAVGKVVVTWDKSQKPAGIIGVLNNTSIFPEMTHRDVKIDLTESEVSGGNITIRYYGEGPQKGEVLAEKTFPIGQ